MDRQEMIAKDGRCLFRLHASAVVLDSAGRLLLVQEQKAIAYGRWNLPGGHIDHGESPVVAAIRETAEETHLQVQPTYLLGIYSSRLAVRFVCVARHDGSTEPRPGDEILAIRWMMPAQVLAMDDADLVAPAMFRRILADITSACQLPLETLTHLP